MLAPRTRLRPGRAPGFYTFVTVRNLLFRERMFLNSFVYGQDRTDIEDTCGEARNRLTKKELRCVFRSPGVSVAKALHPGGWTGRYTSRFGCGSSTDDDDGHPYDESGRRSSGATASRRHANRDLGDPGSTAGRSLALSERPPDEFGGRPSPRTAWREEGRKGARSSRPYADGPKRGPRTRQRSREGAGSALSSRAAPSRKKRLGHFGVRAASTFGGGRRRRGPPQRPGGRNSMKSW